MTRLRPDLCLPAEIAGLSCHGEAMVCSAWHCPPAGQTRGNPSQEVLSSETCSSHADLVPPWWLIWKTVELLSDCMRRCWHAIQASSCGIIRGCYVLVEWHDRASVSLQESRDSGESLPQRSLQDKSETSTITGCTATLRYVSASCWQSEVS